MIAATSTHHWSNDILVEVKNQQIHWFKDDNLIPSPQNTQDMIEHIHRLLKFTSSKIHMKGGTEEELIALLYNKPLEFGIQLIRISICGCNMGNCCTIRNIHFEEKIETYGDALGIITPWVNQQCFWKGRDITYSTCESLIDALKKYNIKVDPVQIKKHMYSYPNDGYPKLYPHHYEHPDGVGLTMGIIKELPLVYDWPHHKEHDEDKGKKLNIQLDPQIIYVSYEWSR